MFTNLRGLGTLLVSSLLLPAVFAQTPASSRPVQANRIAESADLSAKTRLTHQLPAWINPSRDAGQAPADTEVGLTFILARSPQLQTAFEQLLADQQNPASARYHQWLTPQQIGDQYGPTQHDIDALTSWLTTAGLTVKEVTPSKVFIHAYGPAGAVGAALGTSFRMFTSNNKAHLSAATEPIIPAAFAQVIANIGGLTDVELHPMSRAHAPDPSYKLNSSGTGGAHPDYTSSGGSHYVFPGDFAVLFDINPLYSAGINGAGQKVAIIGRSTISNSDITSYESLANLPNNVPNTIIPTTGNNPGVKSGDEGESDLDLQRVIGTAPGVTADFVTSGSANGYDGIYVAAQYEVQSVLDPVLTLSYGACEYNAGASGVNLWSTLFAQAAAEGITVFVSSADSAVDTCDTAFAAPPASTSTTYQGPTINYICSNPYTTCVGGTEFVDTANPTQYWSTSNGAGYTSAISYIPEGGWNDPGTAGSYIVEGSGGGASTIVTKPTFQAGVGVPADGFRDVPDVAFPASGHDGYFGCEADLTFSNGSTGNCANGSFVVFSGTSAAAPSWAGVTALLNQKAAVAHGNLNPLIYRLAANTGNGAFHDVTPTTTGVTSCAVTTPSLCNNSIAGSATSLTGGVQGFPVTTGYDEVTGWGSPDVAKFVAAAIVPYQATTTTVSANPTSITAGSTSTFTATVATTLSGTPTGTVQFFSNGTAIGSAVTLSGTTAVSAPTTFPTAGSFTITATYSGDTVFTTSTSPGITLTVTGAGKPATTAVLSLSATTATTQTAVTATATVTSTTAGTLTGTVQFYNNGTAVGAAATLTAGKATLPAQTFPAGTDSLTCTYSGDTNYASSSCTAVTLTVTSVATTSVLTSTATTGSVLTPVGFTDTVVSTSGTGVPTGTALLKVDGTTRGSAVTLVNGVATFPAATLISGTHTYTVVYSGDTVFAASTSNGIVITLTALTSTSTLTVSPAVILVNGSSTLTVTVTPASGPAPTGGVTIYANGTAFASGSLTTSNVISGSLQFTATGVYSIYAVYAGDSNYAASTSNTSSVTVQGFTASASPTSLTLAAGASTGNTSQITYTPVQGFTGTITTSCTIAYTSGTASIPPTCTVNSVAPVGGATTTNIAINTVAPHAIATTSAQNHTTPTGLFGGMAFAALLFLASTRRRNFAGWRALTLLLFLGFGFAALSGCGGSSTPAKSGGTTTGSYLVTVTGTSGTATASTTVTLTVQ